MVVVKGRVVSGEIFRGAVVLLVLAPLVAFGWTKLWRMTLGD